ncbi:MAG: oligosaccharide flippase family protein [Verrucomicrobiota bacterium]|jgi:O-antigen/teichoic acid export membrane protein
MSRFRRLVHSVASGYIVLVAASVFTLVSWRLALHFLSVERFGLWTLMSFIALFLGLIDFGMSGSVARLLIDHKDDPAGGEYGSLVKTGFLVLLVQGAIAFAVGFVLAPLLSHVEHKNPELQPDFIVLMRWQCGVLALGFASRIFNHLLTAHQRFDIVNYSQIAAMVLNLAFLWCFFAAGQGVFSLVWASLLSLLGATLICIAGCWRLRLFPPAGAWGRVSWHHFKALFDYGKDVFLVAVGAQLILSSQPFVINESLGSAAQAAWSTGTRAFAMISQVIWRIFDYSGPAFSEMMVRGERELLRERYQAVVMVSASLGGVAAVCFVLCNSAFVTVWTHIAWSPINDLLLGVWMIALSILHCHDTFVLFTKKVGAMRYVFFIEGLVFTSAALLSVRWGGLPAVILCSIMCSTCFSGAYGLWRASRYFEVSIREVALGWLAPMAKVLVLFIPAALILWWASNRLNWLPTYGHGALEPGGAADLLERTRQTWHALFHLVFKGVLGGALGLYLFLRYGLPAAFKKELLQRSPRGLNPFLRRVFA